MSLLVFNKLQSTVYDKIWDTQKLDTSVDRKLADNEGSTSIFSKVIGNEMPHSSGGNPYLRCQVHFTSNAVGTKAPQFLDLRLPNVNALDEVNIFGTPTDIIRRLTDVSHSSALDLVFGEATAVGMSATRLEQDYSYKTDFQNWKENQDFGRQHI